MSWGLGHDAIVLVGLLALARFAIGAAAWDTGSGFALMGASRDLTFAVFVEGLFLLVLVLLALPASSTDLVAMSAAGADGEAWREPVRWAAVIALALVVLAETGRQPIDNPDTHLELTMIHEGPLLEYAGRDLALLQWAAAARHWIVLVLVAEVAMPHPGPFAVQLAWLTGWLVGAFNAAGRRRDRAGEDAHPARADAARRRGGAVPAGTRDAGCWGSRRDRASR